MQKKAAWKKLWNQRWRPRSGCGGLIMAKFLITTIQANLCCLLTQIIVYNYKNLGQIFTKFGNYIRLWLPCTCAKFQLDQSMHSWFLCLCKKKKKTKNKNWNFGRSYLGNGWHDLLQLWNVASCYRRAFSPQIWCSSDKRSQMYECVKIITLLFLLIYLLPFAHAPFSWAARHTTVCLDP